MRGVVFSRSLLRPYVRSISCVQRYEKDSQLVKSEEETLGAEAFISKAGSGNAQSSANNQQKTSAALAGHATDIGEQRLNIVGRKVGIGVRPFGLPFMPSQHRTTIQNKNVHGVCHLPPGNCLSILPPGTAVVGIHGPSESLNRHPRRRCWAGHRETVVKPELDSVDEISSSYNLSTGVVVILQTLYAAFTLFESRGDQINRYGYAASGWFLILLLGIDIVSVSYWIDPPILDT